MAERCELTELPKAMCAHCLGHNRVDAGGAAGGQLGPWFAARYDGRCSNCADDFGPGDRIRADGQGGYVGLCCGEEFNE